MATIYSYFDSNEKHKRRLEHMLRSLLYQLLRYSAAIPKGFEALFLSHQKGEQQPSIHALMETTRKAMRDFTQIYIVLDALDECTNRPELVLDFVQAVAGWRADNLHLIMTTNQEYGI